MKTNGNLIDTARCKSCNVFLVSSHKARGTCKKCFEKQVTEGFIENFKRKMEQETGKQVTEGFIENFKRKMEQETSLAAEVFKSKYKLPMAEPKCNLKEIPLCKSKFRIHTLNIAGDYEVDEVVWNGDGLTVKGFHITRIDEDPYTLNIYGPTRAFMSYKDYVDFGIYPIPNQEIDIKEQTDMTKTNLEDLSHETLIDHTYNLQKDYDTLNSNYCTALNKIDALEGQVKSTRNDFQDQEGIIDDLEDETDELRGVIQEQDTKIAKLKGNIANLNSRIANLNSKINDLNKVKNKHIDLQVASSKRANAVEADNKILNDSVNSLANHLKEVTNEKEGLDNLNDKLERKFANVAELCGSLRRERDDLKLRHSPDVIKQESRERVCFARLKFSTVQTAIRFGTTAATAGWLGYLLA